MKNGVAEGVASEVNDFICIILVFIEILHQIVFSQTENLPLKSFCRSLENERFHGI